MKHWVFDLDGTLIDSKKIYEMAIEAILTEFSIEPTDEKIERAFQYFNPEDYFATHFTDLQTINRAVSRLNDFNLLYVDRTPAFQGMEEILSYLRSKKVEISVWTGRDLTTATKILKSTGLMKHIGLCVGRTCVERNKPYPDGLLKVLKDSKSHGDDVIMIGDHEYDVQGARAAKVKVLSVNWEKIPVHAASKISDQHFEKTGDLMAWAQEIYG